MASNEQIVKKADLVMADLTSGGGKMNAEQSNAFYRKLIDAPTMLSAMRHVRMKSDVKEVNKIGLGRGVLRPAVENTGLPEADRVQPTFETIQLVAKKLIAEVRIPYDVIEDAIENGSIDGDTENATDVRATIVEMLANSVAADLEDLALNGDTAGAPGLLAVTDGFLKRTVSHIVDNASGGPDNDMFANGLISMPSKYHRAMAQFKHYVNNTVGLRYLQSLTARQTALGDASITGSFTPYGAGIPLSYVPLMPTASGLLTVANNLLFGIHRDVTLEYERMISEQQFKIVVSCRVDFQIEEEDAIVKYVNIG